VIAIYFFEMIYQFIKICIKLVEKCSFSVNKDHGRSLRVKGWEWEGGREGGKGKGLHRPHKPKTEPPPMTRTVVIFRLVVYLLIFCFSCQCCAVGNLFYVSQLNDLHSVLSP